jgi:hypothetical protein
LSITRLVGHHFTPQVQSNLDSARPRDEKRCRFNWSLQHHLS